MEKEGKFKKYERTTQEQLQYFVKFSKEHPDILKNSYGTKGCQVHNLWIELADILNDMRGPTRTADKWKECLKNRINQIRCRARKSMLGCSRHLVNAEQHSHVDETRDSEINDESITKVKYTTQSKIEEQVSHDVNYYDTLQSFNGDASIIKDEIHSIDLDSTDSNHSCVYMDMDIDTLTRHSNHSGDRQSEHITHNQLEILIAFVKRYNDIDADTKNTIDFWNRLAEVLNNANGSTYSGEEWKETLKEWRNQLITKIGDSEEKWPPCNLSRSEQEALHLLRALMVDEKSITEPNINDEIHNLNSLRFQPPPLTCLKQEPVNDNLSEALPYLSDNEGMPVGDTVLNRNGLNCGSATSPITANNPGSRFKRSPHSSSEYLPKDFMDLIRESISKREERAERANVQQKLITNALELLNKNLETMTAAILKLNEKLDKL